MFRPTEIKRPANIALMSGLCILAFGMFTGVARLYQRVMTERTLVSQLQMNVFELSRTRATAEDTRLQMEEEKRKQEQQAADEISYFSEVPLVISTLDGKGRLVGFSRLRDNNGTAQYSFIINHEEKAETVSGTISNQAGRLTYSDDYSTPSEIRTSGEITHSKPNSTRLRINFVVTASSSEKYRVGDTFYATFVLPSETGAL
jgi:hypothetical protein